MDQFYSVPTTLPLTPLPPEIPPSGSPLTVHGAGLTVQALAAITSRDRTTRWLPLTAALLLLIFGLSAAGLAMGYVGYVEGMFLMAMLPVIGLAMAVGWHSRKNAAAKQQVRAARLYAASVAGGVTTTVYPDRIEQHSSRVRRTVFFTDTTVFVENYDSFFVETDGVWVAVAAADVTPWEAQTIYEMIAAAVPPERQFAEGRFIARRADSAPPPFSNEPPVCYERVEYREEADGGIVWPSGMSMWLFAAALSVSGMFTTLFAMTPFFFLDYLIVFTVCFLCGLIASLAVLQYKKHTAAQDVALSFTSEGLLIERAGRQEFVNAADVYARRTENGVKLFTPAGVFTVPWSVTKNRQQLEWMLFSQRPSSF